jgi:hypothetical protein
LTDQQIRNHHDALWTNLLQKNNLQVISENGQDYLLACKLKPQKPSQNNDDSASATAASTLARTKKRVIVKHK